MNIRWVEFDPKVAPSAEVAALIAKFRPEFGNEQHIGLSNDYGRLLGMYRGIALKEARQLRKRSRRRFTVAEAEADVLERHIVEQLKAIS